MKRVSITPRKDWQQKISEHGFLYYDLEGYYTEDCAYEFSLAEIEALEMASAKIFDMCLSVVEHVISHELWDEFFIPRQYAELIKWSWENDKPSFYGRFDLAYRDGQIKLLEFNADTPTSLLESSVIQWYWLQEFDKTLDQYNSIHEKLLAHLRDCKAYLLPGKLYFSCVQDSVEDKMTVSYLQDVADQAGISTDFIYIDDISLDAKNHFTDPEGTPLRNVFKLYPYEWMMREPFGENLWPERNECLWIEPAYKAILSNKMLLKYLYELFPDSPYILPCTFVKPGETPTLQGDYVLKPVFSREGANVSIIKDGQLAEQTGGDYGEEGFMCQRYFALPDFEGNKAVIGSWMIGGEAAGMGIRESGGLISGNTSRFCPHYIK
jgi:glutathionylspermidine synthase